MRIVVDVNVLVSATIAPLGIPRAIITAWQDGFLDLVISDGIIAEVEEKLHYSRISTKYHLTEKKIQTVVTLLRTQTEMISISPQAIIKVTGDSEDDYVLATAVSGEVDYLITGDIKMQKLDSYQGVKILSPREFLRKLV